MVDRGKRWHRESITPAVEQVLSDLSPETFLENFYLAGGTGLALQLGHRRSRDLDLFSYQAFDPEPFVHKLQRLPGFGLTAKGEATLHFTARNIKVSLLAYPYPLLFSSELLDHVKVADLRDIACMKISAIAGRAAKRDFIDLYFVAQDLGLPNVLDLFKQKFEQAHYSLPHLLKSLTFFEEAETDPMPDMLAPVSWPQVKEFFSNQVPRLL